MKISGIIPIFAVGINNTNLKYYMNTRIDELHKQLEEALEPSQKIQLYLSIADKYDETHNEAECIANWGKAVKMAEEEFGTDSKEHVEAIKRLDWLLIADRYWDYLDTFMSWIKNTTNDVLWWSVGTGYKNKYDNRGKDPEILDKALYCIRQSVVLTKEDTITRLNNVRKLGDCCKTVFEDRKDKEYYQLAKRCYIELYNKGYDTSGLDDLERIAKDLEL